MATKTWPSGWCLNTGLCFNTALIRVNMPTWSETIKIFFWTEKTLSYQGIVRSCCVPTLATFIKL